MLVRLITRHLIRSLKLVYLSKEGSKRAVNRVVTQPNDQTRIILREDLVGLALVESANSPLLHNTRAHCHSHLRCAIESMLQILMACKRQP